MRASISLSGKCKGDLVSIGHNATPIWNPMSTHNTVLLTLMLVADQLISVSENCVSSSTAPEKEIMVSMNSEH